MLTRLGRLAFAILLTPLAAAAGPWPRDEGASFLSFSTQVTTPSGQIGTGLQSYTSLYYERGMKRRLTFGVDAGVSESGAFSGFAFLRAPILQRSETHLFAFRVGLGATGDNGSMDDVSAMIGGYWGRGLDTRLGSGWATLDVQMHHRFGQSDVITKADATLGIKPSERWKVMLQVQAGRYPGSDPYVRLAPSVAWEVKEGRHIEFGAQVGVVGDDRIGLKLGSWLEF